jgi:hypothetical protein
VATPTNEPVKVTPDAPVDDVVANLIQTVARKGRGFVLDLAKEEGKVTVEVCESLRPHDDYLPPADHAAHQLLTTDSLITYATRYGDPKKSLVFFAEEGCSLVIDECVENGSRAVVTLDLPTSEDWDAWQGMLNRALDHRTLLQFLLAHEFNLVNPDILQSMASVKATSTVNYESDIRDEGKQVGIIFKTQAGEELKKFPKQFDVRLPILEADEGADRVDVLTIRLDITLPDSPSQKVSFTLYCSNWRSKHKERVEREGVQSGAYRDDGPELDASLDKLQAAIDAAKAPATLAESMHKPDLAERERAAFDELNDGERWDGLS